MMQDNSDGRGPFISHWGKSLGPWPTIADGFTEYQLKRSPKEGVPIEWDAGPGLETKPAMGGLTVLRLIFTGVNLNASRKSVELTDAYIESGITGRKVKLSILAEGGPIPPIEANPIPYKAVAQLKSEDFAPPDGMQEGKFLTEWGNVHFFAEYADSRNDHLIFDTRRMSAAIRARKPLISPVSPRVTRKRKR